MGNMCWLSGEQTSAAAFSRFRRASWCVLNVVTSTADQKRSVPSELKPNA